MSCELIQIENLVFWSRSEIVGSALKMKRSVKLTKVQSDLKPFGQEALDRLMYRFALSFIKEDRIP